MNWIWQNWEKAEVIILGMRKNREKKKKKKKKKNTKEEEMTTDFTWLFNANKPHFYNSDQ